MSNDLKIDSVGGVPLEFSGSLNKLLNQHFIMKTEHERTVADLQQQISMITSKDAMANRMMELFQDRRDADNTALAFYKVLLIAQEGNQHPNNENCTCVCCEVNAKIKAVLKECEGKVLVIKT